MEASRFTNNNLGVGSEAWRIIIAEDSAVTRGILARLLRKAYDCKVVAMAENGMQAVERLQEIPADIVILDIEMPVMDGLSAITPLRAIDPAVQIIMSSALTQKNAAISLRALALGASDYIAKPSSLEKQAGDGTDDFSRSLLEKVRGLGMVARRKGVRLPKASNSTEPTAVAARPVGLRPMPQKIPAIIAIGTSTGGPQALTTLITKLGNNLTQPVLITQHMPAFFTASLAQNISAQCGVKCAEARDGETPLPGSYYLAPGDVHLVVEGRVDAPVLRLSRDKPENYCRPSVNPMFRSVAAIYGPKALALILTGMGQDGCSGSTEIVRAGGTVIAQDEVSSVVWGMPGAVVQAGLCSAIVPIPEMAALVMRLAHGEHP